MLGANNPIRWLWLSEQGAPRPANLHYQITWPFPSQLSSGVLGQQVWSSHFVHVISMRKQTVRTQPSNPQHHDCFFITGLKQALGCILPPCAKPVVSNLDTNHVEGETLVAASSLTTSCQCSERLAQGSQRKSGNTLCFWEK
jgi:hypothetical protein